MSHKPLARLGLSLAASLLALPAMAETAHSGDTFTYTASFSTLCANARLISVRHEWHSEGDVIATVEVPEFGVTEGDQDGVVQRSILVALREGEVVNSDVVLHTNEGADGNVTVVTTYKFHGRDCPVVHETSAQFIEFNP
mgnify:CR=1 FL=1